MIDSFNDYVTQKYQSIDPKAICRAITLQVTEDCCLNCSYCYQIHKSHKMMSKTVAKNIIDSLFDQYNKNEESAVINHHTKGIVFDFIGGEPFMNVEVIDYAYGYFLDRCIKENHIWLFNSRASITTNGMLYFTPAVQKFLDKYQNIISLTVSIDGPEELHDSCRVDSAGHGSFKTAIAAWKDWQKRSNYRNNSTKVTIAPENLEYLNEIFDFFISIGCKTIHANPIFEAQWTKEQAKIYYDALIKLANTLLAHNDLITSLFDEAIGQPLLSIETGNWCGGTGAMLAYDTDGLAYPCLRYMSSSLGDDQPPLVIGDYSSIYNTPETKKIKEELDSITRQSQSTQDCINCHIAAGCAYCSAYNYQLYGTYNKRSTNLCWMHRARVLANAYYWNLYYKINNIPKDFPIYLDRGIATQIIDNKKYDKLLLLSKWRR